MTGVTKDVVPLHLEFRMLGHSAGWTKLSEGVKREIEILKSNFFALEDRDAAETLRIKIAHYEECWAMIRTILLNSAQEPKR